MPVSETIMNESGCLINLNLGPEVKGQELEMVLDEISNDMSETEHKGNKDPVGKSRTKASIQLAKRSRKEGTASFSADNEDDNDESAQQANGNNESKLNTVGQTFQKKQTKVL